MLRRSQSPDLFNTLANPTMTMDHTTAETAQEYAQEYTGQLGLPLPQEISGEVLLEKYAKGNERDVREVRSRVARALASIESRRQAAPSGRPTSSTPRKTASCPPAASTRPPAPISAPR